MVLDSRRRSKCVCVCVWVDVNGALCLPILPIELSDCWTDSLLLLKTHRRHRLPSDDRKWEKKKHFHSFFWVYISFLWLLFNSVKKCTSWSILAAFFVLYFYRFVIDFSYKGRKVRLTLSFQDNRLVLILRLHPESIRIFSSQAKNIQYRTSSIILHNVLSNLHMVVKETSSSLCTEWLH